MDFFLNELSLEGQFKSVQNFIQSLKIVYQCKVEIKKAGFNLYCDRRVSMYTAVKQNSNKLDFVNAVYATKDNNLIKQICGWIAKSGPFLEEEDKLSSEDIFQDEFGNIVTGSTIAEAALRIYLGRHSHLISFFPSTFNKNPLTIIWIYENIPRQVFKINNFWQIKPLLIFLTANFEAPKSWENLLTLCSKKFSNLTFAKNIVDILNPHPFSHIITHRVLVLLEILNELNSCFQIDGRLNERGNEIVTNYFQGANALFSDESDTNKNNFRKELTFDKPGSENEKIFCPWHGKIRTMHYRIHFNWPKESPDDPLYIVYIGPKITRR